MGQLLAAAEERPRAQPDEPVPAPREGWSWYTWPQGIVVVRVTLADGTTGIGYSEDGVGAATLMVNAHLGRLATGLDASATEQIWEQLYRASLVYGRKGAAIEAISAIDIAVWDAVGKSLGRPSTNCSAARTASGSARTPARCSPTTTSAKCGAWHGTTPTAATPASRPTGRTDRPTDAGERWPTSGTSRRSATNWTTTSS
ncbi:hypothetical protein NKH77_11000 [Streptomyces sp. M19]